MGKNATAGSLSPSARRLIDAAEELIGVHGVDNVSNVHIAQAAGHRNKYAVQYHFGSRDDLIKQVFDDRLSRINQRRHARLAAISAPASVEDYVRALIIPMHEEVDAAGLHKYAKFMSRVMDSAPAVTIWETSEHSSSALETRRLIRQCAAHLSDAQFALRYEFALELVAGAFRAMDRQLVGHPHQRAAPREDTVEALLTLAIDTTTRLFSAQP